METPDPDAVRTNPPLRTVEEPLREIVALLREATGESQEWSATITGTTRIDDDLRLESMELAALAELLQQRYGTGVDLLGHLAGLDLDGIIAFTVADLVRLVRQR